MLGFHVFKPQLLDLTSAPYLVGYSLSGSFLKFARARAQELTCQFNHSEVI